VSNNAIRQAQPRLNLSKSFNSVDGDPAPNGVEESLRHECIRTVPVVPWRLAKADGDGNRGEAEEDDHNHKLICAGG
jgi:hypothetical protein